MVDRVSGGRRVLGAPRCTERVQETGSYSWIARVHRARNDENFTRNWFAVPFRRTSVDLVYLVGGRSLRAIINSFPRYSSREFGHATARGATIETVAILTYHGTLERPRSSQIANRIHRRKSRDRGKKITQRCPRTPRILYWGLSSP